MAYVAGKPIMNDKEYDDLKLRLKVCYFFFFFFFFFIESKFESLFVADGASMNMCNIIIISLIIEGKKEVEVCNPDHING